MACKAASFAYPKSVEMADLTAVYGKPCQTNTFVTVHVFGFKFLS
jgi:hypothetical protein